MENPKAKNVILDSQLQIAYSRPHESLGLDKGEMRQQLLPNHGSIQKNKEDETQGWMISCPDLGFSMAGVSTQGQHPLNAGPYLGFTAMYAIDH